MKKKIVYIIIGLMVIFNVTSATVLAMANNSMVSNENIILAYDKEEQQAQLEKNQQQNQKDFWGHASSWFDKGDEDLSKDKYLGEDVIKTLEEMILVLGTTVIVLATIVLGIKFMFGSVESKVDAKEGLFNLLVACLFFFGWNSIKTLLIPGNSLIFINSADQSYTQPIARIFSIATYAAQFIAVIAIIYVGIRYIFAGVEGKTDLKEKSPMFFIGVILAFCSTGFLTYISQIINEALAK